MGKLLLDPHPIAWLVLVSLDKNYLWKSHDQNYLLNLYLVINQMGSGSSVFSPIGLGVYNKQQQQQSHSLSPMNKFSREQQRLSQPLISADGYVYQVNIYLSKIYFD